MVNQAGVTMGDVVSSIALVTNIMGSISAASREQSLGVNQVSEAVMQMDQVTQQNAALVEEMAAAAGSLKSQALALVETVAVFKLDGSFGDEPMGTHAVVVDAASARRTRQSLHPLDQAANSYAEDRRAGHSRPGGLLPALTCSACGLAL